MNLDHRTKLDKVTPLHLFLFLIMGERVAEIVRQIKNLHVLKGVEIGRREIEINMLQFADDTLFICMNKI